MAQSEIPVAWIGLGGAVAGAVATAAVGRFAGRASIKAATVAKVDTLQDGLTRFCAPFIEARIQLRPALGGHTPTEPWQAVAPGMSRSAPAWTSMAADPVELWEMPGVVRRKAAYVDAEIRSHQSRTDQLLLPAVHSAVRELYQEAKELMDTYTREFQRLVKRGLGVM
ncbi:hypothetical protein OHA79_18920 [Streptomyces sp. NBC_00841]|uniref:hypothetical protein n=1 Tax=unclassified Streptomyces TaxID=2593676 RepID=UPI00224D2D4A|nr:MULTISPECIES: hypothetical protein [unclassified Streptomyces]MCX4534941.1 hypothetical protein [Streptomyces sp. NBC_01669]WRZ99738.1 hypothetical protein OHA79_18920 [Streptomyces sp. NBC_00841]